MTEERTDPVAPEGEDAGAADGVDEAASIEELRAALEETQQQYLRAVADYQNLQRRAKEERAEFGRYQLTALILNFLPVLDDLERAVESVDADVADRPWVEGVRLVHQKFRGVLEATGVTEAHALNQPFDPARHEAMGSAPGPEGEVVRVLRRGYELEGRMVRAAMVMVGSGEDAETSASSADEADEAQTSQ